MSLNLVSRESRFNDAELDQLLQFHHFLFAQVLRLDKDPMRFEPRNASCGYIVVPLNAGRGLIFEKNDNKTCTLEGLSTMKFRTEFYFDCTYSTVSKCSEVTCLLLVTMKTCKV